MLHCLHSFSILFCQLDVPFLTCTTLFMCSSPPPLHQPAPTLQVPGGAKKPAPKAAPAAEPEAPAAGKGGKKGKK